MPGLVPGEAGGNVDGVDGADGLDAVDGLDGAESGSDVNTDDGIDGAADGVAGAPKSESTTVPGERTPALPVPPRNKSRADAAAIAMGSFVAAATAVVPAPEDDDALIGISTTAARKAQEIRALYANSRFDVRNWMVLWVLVTVTPRRDNGEQHQADHKGLTEARRSESDAVTGFMRDRPTSSRVGPHAAGCPEARPQSWSGTA